MLVNLFGKNEFPYIFEAPEIITASTWTQEECKSRGGYGKEVDSWSLGAILYVL
jgi:hypothetical protein